MSTVGTFETEDVEEEHITEDGAEDDTMDLEMYQKSLVIAVIRWGTMPLIVP